MWTPSSIRSQALNISLQLQYRWGSGSPWWCGRQWLWDWAICFIINILHQPCYPKLTLDPSPGFCQLLRCRSTYFLGLTHANQGLITLGSALFLLIQLCPCVPSFALLPSQLVFMDYLTFLSYIYCDYRELRGRGRGIQEWVWSASLIWNLDKLFVFSVLSMSANKAGINK